MTKASDNPYPSILVVEETTPASPAAGQQRLFIDSADHALKRVDDTGTVTDIEGGGGSAANPPAVTTLTADKGITATSSATAVAVATVTFTPTGSAALVSISGFSSGPSGTTNCFFRVSDGTTEAPMGNFVPFSAGAQMSHATGIKFTGLTPGSAVTFTLKVWVNSGGRWNCRPASFPDSEWLILKAEDCV